MKKKYAAIHCNPDGEPYLIIVTDGDYTTNIPVKNSTIKTCKSTIKTMFGKCDIWISQEVESDGTR